MNKKGGFTLIELLAVIVILAIIALIATPIVLNIISDAKKESDLRSAEFYIKGLELSIAQATLKGKNVIDGNHKILSDGSLCMGDLVNGSCPIDKILEVEVKGKVPSGTVTIENGQIVDKLSTDANSKTELVINEQTIVMQDGELTYPKESTSICKLQDGYTANEIGSKYECEVKPGTKYYFYILSKEEDGTTNLIMDQNINSDGTPAGMTVVMQTTNPNQYNVVAWANEDDYGTLAPYDNILCNDTKGCVLNDKGPITAMKFLYNATKDWTNVPALNYEYKDREYHGIAADNTTIGYTSFVANYGVLTITPLTGTVTTIGTSEEPLRARMPIYSGLYKNDGSGDKISEKGEVATKTESNTFLFNNLKTNDIGPTAYWTISSSSQYSWRAWGVYHSKVLAHTASHFSYCGVRPVINLKI